MIKAMTLLTNAVKVVVENLQSLKEEVTDLRNNSILIHKDVYAVEKMEFLQEIEEGMTKRSSIIEEKLDGYFKKVYEKVEKSVSNIDKTPSSIKEKASEKTKVDEKVSSAWSAPKNRSRTRPTVIVTNDTATKTESLKDHIKRKPQNPTLNCITCGSVFTKKKELIIFIYVG